MEYTVQALEKGDREQWERLYRGYADYYQVPMNDEILGNVWQWIFNPEQDFFSLMAKDSQGVAIGLMHFRAMPSPLRGCQVGFLDDLFVDPGCRGSGVVDLMFDHLKQAGQQQGWSFVRWITAENNYRGRAVYDRLAAKTPWQTYQLECNN